MFLNGGISLCSSEYPRLDEAQAIGSCRWASGRERSASARQATRKVGRKDMTVPVMSRVVERVEAGRRWGSVGKGGNASTASVVALPQRVSVHENYRDARVLPLHCSLADLPKAPSK